ncbi:MAG TPA: sugar transporter, partial [Planctomycetaceae bacterium]
MQLVQFFIPGRGRRVGIVRGEQVLDLTSAAPAPVSVVELALHAFRKKARLAAVVDELARSPQVEMLAYDSLLAAEPGGKTPWLLPPVDHADPARVLVSGTGLTHLGSVKSRDEMHGGKSAAAEPQTDSAKMFAMGLS